jgi:hypothetical protein
MRQASDERAEIITGAGVRSTRLCLRKRGTPFLVVPFVVVVAMILVGLVCFVGTTFRSS